jgi:DNA-directed RNA polymerase specialized sigma24 family protein
MAARSAEATVPPDLVADLEQEQLVQDAIAQLPPRCREMIELLFFESPPLPYADVARRLRLATGSIGFIRGRCLERLKKILEAKGF